MNQIQPHNQISQDAMSKLQSFGGATGVGLPADQARHDLDFIGRERDIGDFRRAVKHSNRVELLKYLLPIIGMIIIALIMAALILRPKLPIEISIGDTGIEDGKLVMSNPKLDGFDPQNRPYSVEALRAIQSIENPTLVHLEKIKAKLPMNDSMWANITAGNGSFDVTHKKLELGGGVSVITTDGIRLELKDAYMDLKAGTMITDRAISFTSENASISSQSLKVYDNGDRIVFETNGVLIIRPSAMKSAAK